MPRPRKPAGTAADQLLAVRLTAADHALVGQLVAHHRAELSKLHVAGSVTPADVIRTLLRREAERVGIQRAEPVLPPAPSEPEPTEAPLPPPRTPKGRATRTKPATTKPSRAATGKRSQRARRG